MPAVIVNEDRCQSSQVCVEACPHDAINMVAGVGGREVAHINDRCVDCLLCVPACPQQAILLVATYGLAAEPEVFNGIWAVVPDTSPASLQFVQRTSSLAHAMHAWTGVVLLGSPFDETMLRSAGARTVVHSQPATIGSTPVLVDELTQLVDEREPDALLFADSPPVRDVAAHLAGRLDIELVTDVCDAEPDHQAQRLRFHRVTTDPSFASVVIPTVRPQLAVLTMNGARSIAR